MIAFLRNPSLVALSALLIFSSATTAAAVNAEETRRVGLFLFQFEEFEQAFGKVYATPEEREERRAIFEANVDAIMEHNTAVTARYSLDINEFADRRVPEELPLGYVKKSSSAQALAWDSNAGVNFLALSSSSSSELPLKQSTPEAEEFLQTFLNEKVVPVSELPKEVDWRTKQVTTAVKQQGFCGSCWAFGAAAVMESHIALQTGQLYTLSPQEMVSCVKNPQHCGGDGGCGGATYELAFDYVMQHGIVSEDDFPYKSGTGSDVTCSLEKETNKDTMMMEPLFLRGTTSNHNNQLDMQKEDAEEGFIDDAVATIQGYVNFPTNNYTVLMNAVAQLGPIGVTVAASKWGFYSGGVFDGGNHNSTGATDVNHAVVLEGYGVDQETQEPYWLIRNSWGSWGEGGYIRLKRVDPSTYPDTKQWEEDNCGVDMKPADGAGCTKDEDGNDIVPPPVKVCGTSAVLYDTFVPIGGRLLQKKTTPTQKAEDATNTVITGQETQTE